MHTYFHSEVRILTRRQQIAYLLSLFIVAPSIFMGMFFLSAEFGWAGGLPMTAIAGLFVFALVHFFPRKDEVTITKDRLIFKLQPPIAFSNIATYNTDGYLKLVLRDGTTHLLSSDNYREFHQHLERALTSWQPDKTAEMQRPKRTHFYGMPPARISGLVIVTVSVGGIIVMYQLPRMPISAGILIGSLIPLGLMMLLSKQPTPRK